MSEINRETLNRQSTTASLETCLGFMSGVAGAFMLPEAKELTDYIASFSCLVIGAGILVKGIYDFTKLYHNISIYLENNPSESSK